MTVRTLRDFLPLVTPYAPGVPYITATQMLRLAAIEWCERTRAWRSLLTVELTAQGQAIVAPDYATIHEIETAHLDGRPLEPTQYSMQDPAELEGATENAGHARYITQTSPGTVSVLPFQTGSLRLSLFLKPRGGPEFGSNGEGGTKQDDQNVLPEHVFIQDAEAIAQGGLYRILSMPNVPWANPSLAAVNLQHFNDKANAKFANQITGQQRARRRTTAHWI